MAWSRRLTVGLIAGLLACPAYAADAAKPEERKSLIEMHQKMAERHKAAADCLKANKSADECNREAMKDCPMKKSGMCPFMGGMGRMDKMHERMMGQPEKEKKETERAP